MYRDQQSRDPLQQRVVRTAMYCITLQHTATHCNILRHTATHPNKLNHTVSYCNTLQLTATHCNTLQHTATHCNILRHTVINNLVIQKGVVHTRRHAQNTLGMQNTQHIATHTATQCNILWSTISRSNSESCALQLTATYCNLLQLTATYCNLLQLTAKYCDTWQHTHCSTLQHIALHGNTPWSTISWSRSGSYEKGAMLKMPLRFRSSWARFASSALPRNPFSTRRIYSPIIYWYV